MYKKRKGIHNEPVLLGVDIDTEEAIHLSAEARLLGNYVIGIQGMGKSNLLLQIALADISNGEGVCVLTPHAELIQDILMRIPEDRWDDVVVFDPADSCPIGLNIFEWGGPDSEIQIDKIADDVVTKTFKLIWADMWGPRMEEMMANISRVILYSQSLPLEKRPTLAEFSKIVGRGRKTAYREFLLSHIRSQYGFEVVDDLDEYWAWFDGQAARFQEEIASSTLNKARPFRANMFTRHVVGQSVSKINFRTVMGQGKILLVDLNVNELGTGNAELLGSLIVGRLFLTALARETKPQQDQYHIIADEFGYFATPAFASLQDQARKFGVDVLVAHQRRGQLDQDTRDATRSARNWVVFNVNTEDARELSSAFDTTPPEPEVKSERLPLGYAGNPWSALKRRAHENSDVMDLVHEIDNWLVVGEKGRDLSKWRWLRKTLRLNREEIKELRLRWDETEEQFSEELPVWPFKDEAERDAFEKSLNSYLYKKMIGEAKNNTESLLYDLGDRLFCYRIRASNSGRESAYQKWLPVGEVEIPLTLTDFQESKPGFRSKYVDKYGVYSYGEAYIDYLQGPYSREYIPRLWYSKGEPRLSPDGGLTAFSTMIKEFDEALSRAIRIKRMLNLAQNELESIKNVKPIDYKKKVDTKKEVRDLQGKLREARLTVVGVIKTCARVAKRIDVIKSIEKLGNLLAKQPVYIQGGDPVREYEPMRLRTDVAEEWRNRFAHLPQFEAWCRVQQGRKIVEHHIRTLKARDAPEDGFENAKKIRERSRKLYGVSRGDIERMMSARMAVTQPGEELDDIPPFEPIED